MGDFAYNGTYYCVVAVDTNHPTSTKSPFLDTWWTGQLKMITTNTGAMPQVELRTALSEVWKSLETVLQHTQQKRMWYPCGFD